MAEVQKTTQSGELSQRFIEFVVMHAQNAALFLGQIPNPKTGEAEVNLDLARMSFQFANGICGSCRGKTGRRCAARGASRRAVTKAGGTTVASEARTISPDQFHRIRDGVEKEIHQELRPVAAVAGVDDPGHLLFEIGFRLSFLQNHSHPA